jgi:glycosyltransferase involved in cell wall biosynthesis
VSGPFRQILPDLALYRRELVAQGAPDPLPSVPFDRAGLFHRLPSPAVNRAGWPWNTQTPPPPERRSPWPAITVVMPSFKQGEYLEEAIRSVLLQNYPRLEFVIFDGGSPDLSPSVIEKYRPWLSFACSAPDRGQAHAINLGFSLGRGDICGWLNSDDFYLPGTLQRVAEAWIAGAEFIHGDGLELDAATGNLRLGLPHYARSRYARFPGIVFQPSAFWSARLHEPLWEEQFCAMDYEFWIRMLPKARTKQLRSPLSVARRHDAGKTYNPAMKQRWNDDAHRNGLAHPHLYADTWGNRWIRREYRIVQKLFRAWRRIGCHRRLERVRAACGWQTLPTAA